MLRYNKGEWSEIYVMLKLLCDGKLFLSDYKKYYTIIKVLRNEDGIDYEYILDGNICLKINNSDNLIPLGPKELFCQKSDEFYTEIRNGKGAVFSMPEELNLFLDKINIFKGKRKSSSKSDIDLIIHDTATDKFESLDFSIKSDIGKKPTLFNPAKGTNFIYQIKGDKKLSVQEIKEINSFEPSSRLISKSSLMLKELKHRGYNVKFLEIQSANLTRNLISIDSKLPEILSYFLLYKYLGISNDWKVLADHINQQDHFEEFNSNLLEIKIKNFLYDSLLGMTPEKPWDGDYDANGGMINVNPNGDVVCLQGNDIFKLKNTLLEKTRLEQPSRGRYDFGKIYEDNNLQLIKFNLQVRYK